ncbi:MarR family winged helix-turn-helix transcriptional regulator [Clostridium cochlearium]|uniref:MarR family transcriptional regulator n=1 Tax=Clostridium cochlearium TaxID=1494 RepID=A0A240AQ94_CLOCO|nr:MarR family transcriptional regulator [Clostridium cochlearium]MBV1817182.1 MarR family transcriptional regulator [Bacteroidales bacterium MSK.15.36]NSJ91460.1 MarR family transcriptional regulator [Coprococcus sp. MSK.21.13]MBE6064639.1 MarR family transcriptional regulator [Clostridium cochlearium]MBU5268410.1 MarR family transcriptional regulator [Clostridium cochlearium]MCG4572650.1 MarR family transcriptional regulator [Clostridium cochlearium]
MFDLDTCLGFITNNVAKEIAECFNDRLNLVGITRVQWIALYYLGEGETISQCELAEKMGIKASSVARLIDRMEREEYVLRKRSQEDKRRVDLYITDKGKKLREKLLPEGEKMSKLVSKGISDEEIEIFKKVLKKMSINLIEETNK